MSRHILDRPVWSTLTTRQSKFAIGGELARRFDPTIGPLASSRDESAECLKALARLVPANGNLVLLQAEPVVVPDGVDAVTTASGVQLVFESGARLPSDFDARIEMLTAEDAPAMLELATLTRPGPFEAGTPKLGEFWGIKDQGRLLAMAGERMKHPGYAEVSGVCVHPDARGRGLARALSAFVAKRILDRGEIPYLHAYATNTAAIRLYESLGFRTRREMHVAFLAARREVTRN